MKLRFYVTKSIDNSMHIYRELNRYHVCRLYYLGLASPLEVARKIIILDKSVLQDYNRQRISTKMPHLMYVCISTECFTKSYG